MTTSKADASRAGKLMHSPNKTVRKVAASDWPKPSGTTEKVREILANASMVAPLLLGLSKLES